MSHFRNLFHKPPGHQPPPSPIFPAAAPEGRPAAPYPAPATGSTAAATATAAAAATAAQPLSEFPVEEAHLRPENRLVYYAEPRSPAADRFRLLRMKLKTHWKTGKLKKLLVTSPLPHDGKSTVLLNLATVLAERGKRSVLVVEADLHHSSLTEILRLKSWPGLAECLADNAQPLSNIRRIEPLGWCLLPAGEPRRNPTELLQTPALARVMEQVTPWFDWILVDSPPVVPLTDSLSLQQHTDAGLLVVRAGKTPREAIDQSIEMLGKQHIVGLVLNGIRARDHVYYQYYGGPTQHDD